MELRVIVQNPAIYRVSRNWYHKQKACPQPIWNRIEWNLAGRDRYNRIISVKFHVFQLLAAENTQENLNTYVVDT